MQPLTTATGGYTLTQLNDQLRSSTGAGSVRFDVTNIPGVISLTTVTAATISMNVDQAIKGSLSLTMLADDTMRQAMFRARIQPWYRLRMPDGGIAEWPLGKYLWSVPKRTIDGSGLISGQGIQPETWAITCGDVSHVLDLSGPGIAGFTIPAGTFTTDAMRAVLGAAGINDFTGIVPSAATVSTDLTFDVTNAKNQPTTWLAILTQLCASIGYYDPWSDLNGVIRCIPAPALATANTTMNYTSGQDGITLTPFATDQQIDTIGNRVFCRAKSSNGFTGVTVSDADVLYPTHPLSHVNVGYYIDQTIDDSTSSTVAALQARGDLELYERLGFAQTATLTSFVWPVHEAYDIVGVQIAGDVDFNATQKYQERGWTIDPLNGQMTHTLRRISAAQTATTTTGKLVAAVASQNLNVTSGISSMQWKTLVGTWSGGSTSGGNVIPSSLPWVVVAGTATLTAGPGGRDVTIVPSAATDLAVETPFASKFAVNSTTSYTASLTISGTNSKWGVFAIDWFTSGGVFISTTIVGQGTFATGGTTYTNTVTSPGTAAFAEVKGQILAPAIGATYVASSPVLNDGTGTGAPPPPTGGIAIQRWVTLPGSFTGGLLPPPTSTYPKRTDTRGFVSNPSTTSITPSGGVLVLTATNASVSNTDVTGGIWHQGSGTLTLNNVRVSGGFGWDGYIRSSGTIVANGITVNRGGTNGLGSFVSHGLLAGNAAHNIQNFDISGAQTGIALGGGPDINHPCYVANGKVSELRQIGSGHTECQFVSITGFGYFHTEFVHFEPSSRTGWNTAAMFMQPASGECWWYFNDSFIAGQNISMYIESAYKATASSWLPSPPPAGHPGHMYATNIDFGPLTSPAQPWATYVKCGFGAFETWTNVREVDASYVPTGALIPRLASYSDSDTGFFPHLSRTD